MSRSEGNDGYGLSLGEYCAEDSAYSAQGRLPSPPDLDLLARRGRRLWGRALLMKRLNALVVPAGQATIHVYGDGRVVLNCVENLEEATTLLNQLRGRS